MDETSYSDPRVIAAINQHFIPIRVDNDRHPDVNRRYNMGGWPTTAFLAASGDVLTGGTYLPPDQLLESLARVKAFFDANQAAVLALEATRQAHAGDGAAALTQIGGLSLSRAHALEVFEGDPDVPGDICAEVALQIVRGFDPMFGGLGADPKFPQPDVFGFTLAYGVLRGSHDPAHVPPGSSALLRASRVLEVVRTTLTNMAEGGMYDHVAGGFFRYSTQRDWGVPHYEKMLEDNARLVHLYIDAALSAKDHDIGDPDLLRRTAGRSLDYMMATLWRSEVPAFAGSQDADEEYYLLDADGRAALAGPYVDPTVYVDWNALAARAMLRAAPVLERPDLADRAVGLLEYLLATARRGNAMAHFLQPDGEVGEGVPLLTDQVAVAAALLDAYEVTADVRWLKRAEALAGWAGEHLRAPDGRLHDRLAKPGESPGLLASPVPALDENALAADVLLRLDAYTGKADYRRSALEVLMAWAPHYEHYGVAAAPYGQALLRYLEHPDHIVVVGGHGDPEARRLHAAALTAPRPLRTVQWLDPDDPLDAGRIAEAGLSAAAGGSESGRGLGDVRSAPAVAAYVCRGTVCSLFEG